MNYEAVYTALFAKVSELVPTAGVHLPNQETAEASELDIDIAVTETDYNIYTECESKHDVSIDMLVSVPVSTGTERIHNIVSRLTAAFDPLIAGSFWAKPYFVRINSISPAAGNISDSRYQINVRISATIYLKRGE